MICVMLAGLSAEVGQGKMSRLIAEAVQRQLDMILCPSALSEKEGDVVIGKKSMILNPVKNHQALLEALHGGIDIIVDFTQPDAVNRNAKMYCELGIPFVMGTTGGDREKLIQTVENSKISAVIATNRAAPVVVFQEMMRFATTAFPNALEGFKLAIGESHQAGKKDVSGTAVNLLPFFKTLGMPMEKEQIISVRDPKVQVEELGIPEEHLGGHGCHTYTMISPDDTVKLEFTHNVLGRSVYVDGALKAIRFLAAHKEEKGKVFSMADVLRWSD